MKVVIVFFIIVLIFGSIGAAVYYNQNSFKSKSDLNQERYTRMLSEENLDKAKSQIEVLELELKNSQDKVTVIQSSLDEKIKLSENLKARLNEMLAVEKALKKEIQHLENELIESRTSIPLLEGH